MAVLTSNDKRTLRTLMVKAIYFAFVICALMFIHLLVGLSNLEPSQKEILRGIDFWGTVAYLCYFLIAGLWSLARIEFVKSKGQQHA
jgi:hypothetical protein